MVGCLTSHRISVPTAAVKIARPSPYAGSDGRACGHASCGHCRDSGASQRSDPGTAQHALLGPRHVGASADADRGSYREDCESAFHRSAPRARMPGTAWRQAFDARPTLLGGVLVMRSATPYPRCSASNVGALSICLRDDIRHPCLRLQAIQTREAHRLGSGLHGSPAVTVTYCSHSADGCTRKARACQSPPLPPGAPALSSCSPP